MQKHVWNSSKVKTKLMEKERKRAIYIELLYNIIRMHNFSQQESPTTFEFLKTFSCSERNINQLALLLFVSFNYCLAKPKQYGQIQRPLQKKHVMMMTK